MFWNLDGEFQNTAVVCLGKPCKSYDPLEVICDDKESVRAAASGKKLKKRQINSILLLTFRIQLLIAQKV